MTGYDRKKQRITRLRKLIIHSADARPTEVTAYIEQLAQRPHAWDEKDQVIKEFRPLAEHLPAAFVAFALGHLIEPPKSRHNSWMDADPGRLGIRDPWMHSPPASPLQGPFLYLLRNHESEGFRLLHSLVNAATARWCEGQRRRGYGYGPRTAIPLKLTLPGGERVFWGDDSLYRWHRGTAVGPDAVVSALMALEFWIEEQLATDRDASELFMSVLDGSESVAVLGVIVGAALARPGSGLDVLAPLVGEARIWNMDIERFGHDQIGTPIIDFLGRYREINQVLSERNRLPQRQQDIRHLLGFYLYDGKWKAVLNGWRQTFGEPLPFQFEEERTDPAAVERREEDISALRPFLDEKNYESRRDAKGMIWLRYSPPEKSSSRNQHGSDAQDWMVVALSLQAWAGRSIEQGSLADGKDAGEVIQAARSFQGSDALAMPDEAEVARLDSARMEAIAQVAAALLTARPRPSLSGDELGWLRSVLLAAAQAPRVGFVIPESIYPSDPQVSAALGLGTLAAAGEADQEVRESLLFLAVNVQHQVVAAVIRGLRDAWTHDPVLCWNCLWLAVSFCCIPKSALVPSSGLTLTDSGKEWARNIWETHLHQLRDGVIPAPPRVEAREYTYLRGDRMAQILDPIPLATIGADAAERQRLIQFHDDLMARTLAPEEEEGVGFPHSMGDYRWEGDFLRRSARMTSILTPEEEEMHVIRPVFATWPGRPQFLDSLLTGYLLDRLDGPGPLPEQAVAAWERIWDTLLGSPELQSRGHWPGSWSRGRELDTLAVFVAHGRYWYEVSWPHAPRFTILIDRWVKIMGVTHVGYCALLVMLKPNVERFDPATLLGWLQHPLQSSQDVRAMLRAHDNGTRTVELISLLRSKRQEQLTRAGLKTTLAAIVDLLIAGGVSAAGLLRQQIEERR